jgi:CRP-like cAMP-binding protein
MSIEDDIAFLERVDTLSLLGHEALRIVAIGAESRYVHDGDILFRQGDIADAGYVVQEGTLLLESRDPRVLSAPITIGPGALLAELALLTETVHQCTAMAIEPSAVLRIPRKLFLRMLEGYPDAASRLRDKIALRAHEAMNDIVSVRQAFEVPEER